MSVNLSDLLPSKQYPQLSPEPFLELLSVPRIEGAAAFYQVNPNLTLTLNILRK